MSVHQVAEYLDLVDLLLAHSCVLLLLLQCGNACLCLSSLLCKRLLTYAVPQLVIHNSTVELLRLAESVHMQTAACDALIT